MTNFKPLIDNLFTEASDELKESLYKYAENHRKFDQENTFFQAKLSGEGVSEPNEGPSLLAISLTILSKVKNLDKVFIDSDLRMKFNRHQIGIPSDCNLQELIHTIGATNFVDYVESELAKASTELLESEIQKLIDAGKKRITLYTNHLAESIMTIAESTMPSRIVIKLAFDLEGK